MYLSQIQNNEFYDAVSRQIWTTITAIIMLSVFYFFVFVFFDVKIFLRRSTIVVKQVANALSVCNMYIFEHIIARWYIWCDIH